ncbi:undecaprenyl diphosphate synthase family protein [Sinanaerobacter chloroacetimidivorans]|jgi:undecaprenyl diphosphate synthase|uniref:Undecaprenyl diphosphate synthase family protein n=1 Tax=Sinanaerobacter chloroacetimidivorans TaxID=2818044 RepID=A0A8J7W4N5_9FIRM|nr:undecaprenyl diphosphate synthase family protein [Sinanaerobacter chloroacetimidivorans]MBR0598981.1 undecaprenyl diphosphate synthase family protein [Sinanaerobacter chloroacetimidivorans]
MNEYKRIPAHIGVIPDGNRRWAVERGMDKKDGYRYGIEPGFQLYELCTELGVQELTLYGFTVDNTKRPANQKKAFQKACVDAVMDLANRDAELLVVGNTDSPCFPKELLPFTHRVKFGAGKMKVNFLVNYGWDWDLKYIGGPASKDISRMDLIVRWGGRRRLSGFLPIQSVYADMYVLDELWPDFTPEHLYRALDWYQYQDVTLGG